MAGNWNLSRSADVSRFIHQHINDPMVRVIEGTYRGNAVMHYLDTRTSLNVIAGSDGRFVGGWRLGADQLRSVMTTGRLF